MLAPVDVVDEHPASRARSGTGTASNRSHLLRAALLQLHHLRRRPVAVAVSAALAAWPPRLQAVPADGDLVSGSPRALVADRARPLRVPFLGEVSLQVRPARTALPHLRFSPLEVAVDLAEGSLQLVGAHRRRQDVSDDDPLHRIAARRTAELVPTALQRVSEHIPSCLYTFTAHA